MPEGEKKTAYDRTPACKATEGRQRIERKPSGNDITCDLHQPGEQDAADIEIVGTVRSALRQPGLESAGASAEESI